MIDNSFVLFFIILIVLYPKIIENLNVREVQQLSCQKGFKCPQGASSCIPNPAVNPFSDPGSPGGLDLLRACDCADLKITGGKPGKIDFCNPPECIKKVPGYQGRCGEENPNIDEEVKNVKQDNPTEFGTEKETAVVKSMLELIKKTAILDSDGKPILQIAGNTESETAYLNYSMGDDSVELITPVTLQLKDLKKKVKLLKA